MIAMLMPMAGTDPLADSWNALGVELVKPAKTQAEGGF